MEFHRNLSGSSLGFLPGSRTSSKILRQLIERNGAAWRAAYVYYGGRIFRWARRRGCSQEVAEEIAQETLARAVKHLPDFEQRERVGGFRAWLKTIASRLLADECRRSIPVVGTGDSSFQLHGGASIEDYESMDEFIDGVQKFIEQHTSLKPATIQHFIEHAMIGRSPAEIAAAENPPLEPDTVYRHTVRTAEALRKRFGEEPPEGFLDDLNDFQN